MNARAYYPLFADLTGRRCVVVGGGMVAQRKVTTLLRFGAKVTVISPAATQRLRRYAQQGAIRYVPRRFKACDLEGAWLVYAATDDQAINQLVFRTATRQHIFTNVVDQPPLCSFIAPAIMKRGDLVIAISTGGASPTVAKRLRREFERTIGTEYAELLRLLNSLRGLAKRKLPSYDDRKRYFDRLVRGRTFAFVRRGKTVAARRAALALLDAEAKRNRN
ncbi:MAG: bifunctional precorrin-2 dehydrogenase/sirohydrochlorin ferrochelatase [Candidatus Omnitrophota bacterium]|nr:bifunctional precorrin-2 dehydrogenase/sirohydrochlorin ferrochelatase [Candidatus Omnitrophota bacterium]